MLARTVLSSAVAAALLCAACGSTPRTTPNGSGGATGTGGTAGAMGAGGGGKGGGSNPVDAAVDAVGHVSDASGDVVGHVSDASGDVVGHVSDASGDVAPPGWRLVWSDEFQGPAGGAVDSTKWKFDLGNNNGWGNAELEDYTDRTQNAALDGNGNLVITARKEALGGQQYTSARLLTQGKASWTYGRFEARIQIPKGQGIWPAFWMLGDNIGTVGWPTCGEVDIMENVGREPTLIHGTMHGPGYSGGNGIGGPASLPGNGAYAAAFHVFAVEWEMNSIRWSVDGTQYFATTPASIPAGTTWVYDHPLFIIMNVAVGGAFPGNPDGTTMFPQTMVVDYVRVFQR